MELNTSGGAIGDPTINRFSTPNDAPGQIASYPLIYINKETGLVTGYQMFTYTTDGTPTLTYHSIGAPGGYPQPETEAAVSPPHKEKDGRATVSSQAH